VLNADGKIALHRPQSAQVTDPQIYCALRFLPVFSASFRAGSGAARGLML